MPSSPIGHRIRARRKALGLTQTALAKSLDISVSYVNLIEHDKRAIGGALLNHMAEVLGLERSALDGAQERRVLDEMAEAAVAATDDPPDPQSARDLLARHEAWTRVLLSLHRSGVRDRQTIAALSSRLDQDPVLNASVSDMLASATAIRSVADILSDAPDLDDAQRARFDAILKEEAVRLSDVARTLARAFESAQADVSGLSAPEEVDDFLYRRSNHFPALEDFAERLGFGDRTDPATLAAHLEDRHGIVLRRIPPDGTGLGGPRRSILDAKSGHLDVPEGVPSTTLRFELARTIAAIEGGDAIRETVAGASDLASQAGRERAERALAAYAAGAVLMPYAPFREAAEALRYDIDALAVRFGTSVEQICHRVTTLGRPGDEGVPFAMLKTNAAGYLTKRFPLPRLPMPRQGGACPLWAIYSAMQAPGAFVARIAELANGERFLMIARALHPPVSAHGQPRPAHALMLACETVHADRLVYSDGLDPGGRADPVGTTCALCPRTSCAHRQETAIRIHAT